MFYFLVKIRVLQQYKNTAYRAIIIQEAEPI
jgi:hypothetical protein